MSLKTPTGWRWGETAIYDNEGYTPSPERMEAWRPKAGSRSYYYETGNILHTVQKAGGKTKI